MHGKMIVLVAYGEKKKVEDFYDLIRYAIGIDYIGDRIYGDDALSIYKKFKESLLNIDTDKMSIKKAIGYDREYPVVIINGYPDTFRSFVEFKAFCDYFRFDFLNGGFEWQVWNFHF